MPLPTDFADLPDDPPARPDKQPTLAHTVTRIELHQVHKEVNKLGTRHDELAAKLDSTIPGADYKTHYDHHARIAEREIESKKLWSEARKALLIGFILFLAGAIFTGFWNYFKYGGGLK